MAKKSKKAAERKKAILDAIRDSKGSMSDAKLEKAIREIGILNLEDNYDDSDFAEMSTGGLATKNYVNPVKIVDNRKKKK